MTSTVHISVCCLNRYVAQNLNIISRKGGQGAAKKIEEVYVHFVTSNLLGVQQVCLSNKGHTWEFVSCSEVVPIQHFSYTLDSNC